MNKQILISFFTILFILTNSTFGQRDTDLSEELLKRIFEERGSDYLEGIYEESISKSKFGIVKQDNENRYSMIFLNGPKNGLYEEWKPGLIKGFLYESGTMGVLRAEFFIFSFGFDTKMTLVNITANGIRENNSSTIAVDYEYNKVYSNKIKKDFSFNDVSSGTCFPISRDGLIVTNYHVIENKNVFRIKGINLDYNKAYNATLVLVDKNNDLAILKINDPKFGTLPAIPYVLKKEQLSVGANIFVLGFPLRSSMGDEIKLTNGIISSKSGFQGDVTTYQISAPVQPGNSGGPLFDSNGDIIGIINAKHKAADNVTYAIKTSYLLNLFESLPTSPKLNQLNTLANRPLSKQVEVLKKFVYIVEAE